MFLAIFTAFFALALAAAIFIGVMKGRKRVWQLSMWRIIITVVAVILSAVTAKLIASALAGGAVGLITDIGAIKKYTEVLKSGSVAASAVKALFAMILSPLLFCIFYVIFRPLLAIPTKKLTKLTVKSSDNGEVKKGKNALKLEKTHWLSALLGGVCGFLTLCVIMFPLCGTLRVADDVVGGLTENNSPMVAEAVHAVAVNPCTVTFEAIGGKPFYNAMTTYKVGDNKATLRNETAFVKSVLIAYPAFGDSNIDAEQTEKLVAPMIEAFDKTTLVPALAVNILSDMSEAWNEGNSFVGIKAPEFGNKDVDELIISTVDSLAACGIPELKADVKTVMDIVVIFKKYDMFANISKPEKLLGDEKANEELFLKFMESPRLTLAVDKMTNMGLAVFMDAVKAPKELSDRYTLMLSDVNNVEVPMIDKGDGVLVPDGEKYKSTLSKVFANHGLKVTDEVLGRALDHKLTGVSMDAFVTANVVSSSDDFCAKTKLVSTAMLNDEKVTVKCADVQDKQATAQNLGSAFANILGMKDDFDGSSANVRNVISKLGPVFESFSNAENVGKTRTAILLKGILQSEYVHDKVGLTVLDASEAADKISQSSDTKGYSAMLASLSLMVDFVDNASKTDGKTDEAVKALMDDLTPESAEIIQTISTPDVIMNYGVPERSAEPVSNIISDTFGNLSAAKENGMSDEEYEKESKAVANMMEVLMTTGKSSSEEASPFGGNGENKKTADDYVNSIMDSKIMSDTIVGEVYGDGTEPKDDPLNSQRNLGEKDKADFLKSVNDKWDGYDEAERNTENEKKIIALGAVMNIKFVLGTDGNWVIAEPMPA